MTTSITAITADNHPVITYQNVRVTTTELLAQFYGTGTKNLRMNFTRNADRFVDGKHYFKLEGENLRQFKELHRATISGSVEISPKINALMLWTQRGAARHAKILDTDKSWDVFEQLEEAYFKPQSTTPALPTDLPTALRMYADQLERTAKLEQKINDDAPKVAFHDQVVMVDKTYTFTEVFGLLKHYTGQTFNGASFLQFLREQGVVCKPNPHSGIGQRTFAPRQHYIGSWFVSQLTPAGDVEWLMRPLAVSALIELIMNAPEFEAINKQLTAPTSH